jgi:hypothetical protein
MHVIAQLDGPAEVFPMWLRAQLEVERCGLETRHAADVLRTTGFLEPELAERVAGWYLDEPAEPSAAVRRSYRALVRDTARLFAVIGRLGVRVSYVRTPGEPYASAAELCAELRERGSLRLATIARDDPHPLLGGAEGGVVDQLRAVHDVLGHAALGVGFDLQSEFATWLQCRTLFSAEARPAAFCELVGAVSAHVVSGEKPRLVAKLPPDDLLD